MKKILIAIPCKNDIEGDTFKSIYDLEIPNGYQTEFQYFYGYAVDQVRNLIADWIIRGPYEYLFAVDHDMVFPRDTLKRLVAANKPVIGGLYVQRLDPPTLEVYSKEGPRYNSEIINKGIVEVGALGFGCTLVHRSVFEAIPYPQFFYHQAVDHNKTLSEDIDFCMKARKHGFTVWADTDLHCEQVGQKRFVVPSPPSMIDFSSIRNNPNGQLPVEHKSTLMELRDSGFTPNVIYDIGANVLLWTDAAREVWPNAYYLAFDAMEEFADLYNEKSVNFFVGSVLYHTTGSTLVFFQSKEFPAGSSIYMENKKFSSSAPQIFEEVTKTTVRLDDLIDKFSFPLPDLIKIDVQGAELDVLRGAEAAINNCKAIVIEVQAQEYNLGGAKEEEVIDFLKERGFTFFKKITKGTIDYDVLCLRD